jgi:hypothetical protein
VLIPISIDTSDLQSEFSMSKEDIESMIDNTVKAITLQAYNNWSQQASSNLNSTRSRYLDNLILVDEGKMKGAVILRDDDPLVMMLEDGASEFDIKEGMAKSPKRKFGKDGSWYMSIPMRFATPSALGESEVFAGVMPPEIYERIKGASTNIPTGGGMRSKGLTLDEIPTQYQEKTVRQAIPKSKLMAARQEYISKSSKFEGLVKMKDSSTGQTSGYMTFRRISEKSDPASWIHKGFEKRNFAEKALVETESQIESITDIQIDNFLNQYLS